MAQSLAPSMYGANVWINLDHTAATVTDPPTDATTTTLAARALAAPTATDAPTDAPVIAPTDAPTVPPPLVWSSFPDHDAATGQDAFEVYSWAQTHTLFDLQALAEEKGFGGFALVDGDAYFKAPTGTQLADTLNAVSGVTMWIGMAHTVAVVDTPEVSPISTPAEAITSAPTAAATAPATLLTYNWERLAGYDVASGADVFSIWSWAESHTLYDLKVKAEEEGWGGFVRCFCSSFSTHRVCVLPLSAYSPLYLLLLLLIPSFSLSLGPLRWRLLL